MSAILGVIALIAGLICVRRPGESLLAVVIVVGIYLVAAGVIRDHSRARLRRSGAGSVSSSASSMASSAS